MSTGNTLNKWYWGSVTFCGLYVILYTLFPLIGLVIWPKLEPVYKFIGNDDIKDAMNAAFSVGLLFIAARYSGVFAKFYEELTSFGIAKVRENRKGQDPALTPMWLNRISDSPEVTIIGTKCRGWFIKAKDELDNFLDTNQGKISKFAVYLLDPHGQACRAEIRGEQQFKTFITEISFVLERLSELRKKHPIIEVFFYDSTPLHCVVAGSKIYFAIALPFQDAASYPELTIYQGTYLGKKIYDEAVKKTQEAASPITQAKLERYCAFLRENLNKTEAEYWNQPKPTD
jgi:hypothetical protein